MNCKLHFLIIFSFLVVSFCSAQLVTTNAAPYDTEEYLVNDVLLGADLVTSNFSSVGFAQGIGYFDGINSNIGFEEGVILSSGGIGLVTGGFGGGSGISGDSDLELALNQINLFWDVNNVTILEFDFVAESESVTFNYVFSSVEYTGYTCSVFNDIFGFFLSGPGINGIYSNDAVNLALVPDPNNPGQFTDTPVAVNTVNAGTPSGFSDADCEGIDPDWESYNVFWIDNDYFGDGWDGPNQPPEPTGTVQSVTGFTVPLQATYDGLTCGETYHIKMAIADASDGALNSAVFIEANSFISPSVSVDAVPNYDFAGIEGGVLEGCGLVSLEFVRSGDMESELPVMLSYSGTSTYGVDYEALPDQIVLPPNVENYILPFSVFFDGIIDDAETLIITVEGLPDACGDVEVQEVEIIIYDQEPIEIDPGECPEINCFGDVAELEPLSISGGIGEPYSYQWQDSSGNIISTEPSVIVTPESDSIYTLTVGDDCGDQSAGPIEFCVEVAQYEPISIDFPDYSTCDNEYVLLEPNVLGGSGNYSYSWDGGPNSLSNNILFDMDLGDTQEFNLTVTDDCTEESFDQSVEISLINPLAPQVSTQSSSPICVGMEGLVSIETIGASDYTIFWDNINPDDVPSGNQMIVYPQNFNNTYTGYVLDNCNQQITNFSIPLDIQEYDGPSFFVEDMEGCEGELVFLNIENLDTDVPQSITDFSFEWSNGEVSQDNYVYVQDELIEYSLTVTDMCSNASTETFSVGPSIPPPPYFAHQEISENLVDFYQTLDDVHVSYLWDFGDGGDFAYEYEPTHTFPGPGEYYVTLTVEDEYGCISEATSIVHIYPNLFIYAPNIFTPNDDGDNDTFLVSAVGADEFELIVFDRWGKEIFRSSDPGQGWDGTYPSGMLAEQSIYTYKVIYFNGDIGEKIKTGTVTLVK